MIIVALIVFFCLQAFVLFCCLAAGNDPGSQEISDQEQMEYSLMVFRLNIIILCQHPEIYLQMLFLFI